MEYSLSVSVDFGKAGLPEPRKPATLTCFILPSSPEIPLQSEKPMVIICPGGAYRFCSDREAEPIAMKFLACGMHAAVLRYTTDPSPYPTAAIELAWCISECRRRAREWHIRPDSIHVIGFSAGGHLACTLGTVWHRPLFRQTLGENADVRPNSQILCYPVITMGESTHAETRRQLLGESPSSEAVDSLSLEKQVTAQTVPTFLWHTVEDRAVPVENSLQYACALRRSGVPFEMHLYEKGGHGLSTCEDITAGGPEGVVPDNAEWINHAIRFIRRRANDSSVAL